MARTVVETKGFEDAVQGILQRAKNARVPLKAWGLHMVGSVKRNFQEQGRPNPWRPLKVNTLIARYLRGKKSGDKEGGRFAPNPNVFKKAGKLSGAYDKKLQRYLGDTDSASTVAGMARSSKTGRVLRSRHGGLNKFSPKGMVFRRPALRAILMGQILLQDGHLRKSITSAVTSGTEVQIGTNLVYAGTHQFGFAGKKIPARPFLVIQEPEDVDEFAALLTDFIFNGEKFA